MWKSVIGYEGHYEVSDRGEIRRVSSGQGAVAGRMISTRRVSAKGYPVAELCVGDRKKRFFLHRIVATAFHGMPPSPKHVVNHLDGVKTNCCAGNLEWTTPSGNARHAVATGLHRPCKGESNGRAKLTAGQVAEIRESNGSSRVLANQFGVARSLIQRIKQGKSWTVRVAGRPARA